MKQASNELIQFLASASADIKVADLYTISLANGTVLYYTSADCDISYGNKIFLKNNACIKRGEITQETGLSVDDLQIEFNPGADDTICNINMIKAIVAGYLDGADFRLDLAFFNNGWNNSPMVLDKFFVGKLDIEEITGSYAKGSVKAPIEKLNCSFPANCYQASCHYVLYDELCTLNKANFTETNKSVGINSSTIKIYCTLSRPEGYYTNGIIEFTDGQNAGEKRTIKLHGNNYVTLSNPLMNLPNTGDKFIISAGCNKTISMCKSKFNNLENFGGTPFIPEGNSTT